MKMNPVLKKSVNFNFHEIFIQKRLTYAVNLINVLSGDIYPGSLNVINNLIMIS